MAPGQPPPGLSVSGQAPHLPHWQAHLSASARCPWGPLWAPPTPHSVAPRAHSSLRHGLASPCTGKGKPLSRMPAHGVSFLLPRFVLGRPAALAREELGCLCHLEVPSGLPDPQPGRHVSLHRSELMGSPDGHIHGSHQVCAAPPSWIPCRHPTSCTPRSRTRPAPDSSH